MSSLPVSIVFRKAQAVWQMFARKTSKHFSPTAWPRDIPIILSAARLKKVMVLSRSTVKTPSAIESRILSCCLFNSSSCTVHLIHMGSDLEEKPLLNIPEIGCYCKMECFPFPVLPSCFGSLISSCLIFRHRVVVWIPSSVAVAALFQLFFLRASKI